MEFFCHIESKNDELPQGKVSTIFNFCQIKWPKYRIFNTFQCPFSSFIGLQCLKNGQLFVKTSGD